MPTSTFSPPPPSPAGNLNTQVFENEKTWEQVVMDILIRQAFEQNSNIENPVVTGGGAGAWGSGSHPGTVNAVTQPGTAFGSASAQTTLYGGSLPGAQTTLYGGSLPGAQTTLTGGSGFSLFGPQGSAAANAAAFGGGAVPNTAAATSAWWQNPKLWTTALGGLSGYFQARDAQKAAQAAGQPTTSVSTSTPHPALAGDIFGDEGILGAARELFNRRGGPPGAPQAQLPAETQQLIDYLGGYVQNPSDLQQSGSQAIQGMLGDPHSENVFLEMLSGGVPSFIGAGAGEGYTPGIGYDARTGFDPSTGGFTSARSGTSFGGFGGGGGGGGGGGAGIGGPNSLFDENIQQFLDFKDISPETQAVIDAMQSEAQEDFQLARGEMAAEFEGAGRFGGSDYHAAQDQLFRRHDQNVQLARSATLERDLIERRNSALAAMGLISQREIAEAEIAAQKEIAARNRAASTGVAMQQLQAQLELGHRGMDIEEMLGLRGQNLDAMGLLLGGAGELNTARLGALSNIPSIEGTQFQGLDYLLPLLSQKGEFNLQNARTAGANATNRWMEPERRLDDYMSRILALSDRFSTRTGTTDPPTPYAGSRGTGALTGVLGGLIAGYGLGGQRRA